MRPQFVALGGFALAVICSAGLGIASSIQNQYPPIPDELPCDPQNVRDASKLRVELAGPNGEVLRDKEGKPFAVPMCPEPPARPGSVPEQIHGGNCWADTNWRGQREETCEVEDCGFDVDGRGELVEVCGDLTRQPRRH